MQCKQLELALEQEDLARLSDHARAHLAECSYCQSLAADLHVISRAASQFPAEVEPPAHIWTALRVQLEKEGIIKTPSLEPVPGGSAGHWWSGLLVLFGARGLAGAALGVLLVTGMLIERQYIVGRRPLRSVVAASLYQTSAVLQRDEATLPKTQRAAPASTMDHSLRKNLEIVNNFIADCERHAKQEPQDDLASDYLSHAYQQKAELLATMMEPGE